MDGEYAMNPNIAAHVTAVKMSVNTHLLINRAHDAQFYGDNLAIEIANERCNDHDVDWIFAVNVDRIFGVNVDMICGDICGVNLFCDSHHEWKVYSICFVIHFPYM
eukprot:235_1